MILHVETSRSPNYMSVPAAFLNNIIFMTVSFSVCSQHAVVIMTLWRYDVISFLKMAAMAYSKLFPASGLQMTLV